MQKTSLLSALLALFCMQTANAQHEYVDLGLPSGTLWATCNIGASSPEQYGDYFAWGETETKTNFNTSTYTCEGYDGSEGSPKELLPKDDAATANWGSEWQTPDSRLYQELISIIFTTREWTTVNGVNGYKITSKRNGKSVFLPTPGVKSGKSLYNDNSVGYYWTRMVVDAQTAKSMNAGSTGFGWAKTNRTYGISVRPIRAVREKHEYVDLGLPSGTCWATCNVGAYTPEDYGVRYRWGETSPVDIFNSSYTYTDNPSELPLENDAANANWGGDWRMPSIGQMKELTDTRYTTWEWMPSNGFDGYKVTSKVNGKSIFLPYTRNVVTGAPCSDYWSRSLSTTDSDLACCMRFEETEIVEKEFYHSVEIYVRPVCFAKKGDVNCDGTVTIADAVAVLNAMAGEKVPGDANVNGDEAGVTVADFVAVLNIMAGQ